MRTGQVLVTRDGPGGSERHAEVIRSIGVNSGPPYLVRWLDTGHVDLLYPDGDVWVEPRTHLHTPERRGNRCG